MSRENKKSILNILVLYFKDALTHFMYSSYYIKRVRTSLTYCMTQKDLHHKKLFLSMSSQMMGRNLYSLSMCSLNPFCHLREIWIDE